MKNKQSVKKVPRLRGTPKQIERLPRRKINNLPNKVKKFYASLEKLKKPESQQQKHVSSVSLSDQEIIAKLSQGKKNGRFFELLAGDTTSYTSDSEADLALCSFVTQVTNSAEAIDNFFRNSRLMRPKWDEVHGDQTYGTRTIQKALKRPEDEDADGLHEKSTDYEIAKTVIKKIGSKNILTLSKQIWLWNQKKGVWSDIAEEELKKRIHHVAPAKCISHSRVNSILGLIITETYTRVSRFNKCDRHVINCSNGELHFEDGEWVLKSHSRDSNFCHQIPVTYDESASCERFDTFLQEVFEPDDDRKEKIRLLQEFFGYVLITSCEYERFLLLVGNGSNGKSVIITMLNALVGDQNISNVLPNQFERLPQLAHLHGKLANIITEIPEGAVIADAKLKSITSGEPMTAEHKFGHPFDFSPYCTLIFSANHLPHTKDTTPAFFRRVEILTFNVSFTGDKCDTTLKDELPKEVSGVLNFALKGLRRLFKTGDFTQVPSSKAAKREWELAADQVSGFIDEECEWDAAAKTPVGQLFEKYKDWALESGIKSTVNKPNLTARLKRLGCKACRGRGGIRMLSGIKLKNT